MKNLFHNLISVFLGFTFWSAGMVKLFAGHLFIGWIGPPALVEQLSEYNLGLYAEFIALSQITIGFMLMTTRFKLLGAIMLIPMIANILMVTISQQWRGTPYVLAVLLVLTFVLLWRYREFFRPILNESLPEKSQKTPSSKSSVGHLVWTAGLGLQFLAIPASFSGLTWGFLVSGLGLVLGILAFRIDRYYLR